MHKLELEYDTCLNRCQRYYTKIDFPQIHYIVPVIDQIKEFCFKRFVLIVLPSAHSNTCLHIMVSGQQKNPTNKRN